MTSVNTVIRDMIEVGVCMPCRGTTFGPSLYIATFILLFARVMSCRSLALSPVGLRTHDVLLLWCKDYPGRNYDVFKRRAWSLGGASLVSCHLEIRCLGVWVVEWLAGLGGQQGGTQQRS